MTENNKPEWFEIAESDGPAAPPKASKTLPLAAVFATALILGIGAVVAQVQEESPATAVDTTSVQTASTNNTTSPTSVARISKSSPIARIANPASSAIAGTSGLQNPSIAQLPTKGGDDDDDDHEGRSHNGDHEEDDEDDEGDDD